MKRLLLVSAALGGAVACTGDAPNTNARSVNDLSMRLTLPDGETIRVVHYVVSGGPDDVDRSGDQNVADSSVLRFRVGELPLGSGYTMRVSAVTEQGAACSGFAPFSIANDDVTTLDMTMTCSGAPTPDGDPAGDIRVNVDVGVSPALVCPVATGISLLPAQGNVGASLQVEGFASSAPDSVSWSSAGSGAFGDASAAITQFTCGSSGDITLNFAIHKSGCPDSQASAVASCGAPGTPFSDAMLAVARDHACMLLPGDGRAACWGNFTTLALGYDTNAFQPSVNFIDATALPQGLQTTWKQISSGLDHSCAISFAGDGYCWGLNSSGQLGTTSALNSKTPIPIDVSALPPGTKWSSLTGGTTASTVCGISEGGTGYCWGSNTNGQVGNPAAPSAGQKTPIAIDVSALPPGTKWSLLSTGQTHTCGITTTGAAYCWGNDANGRLGNGPALTTAQTRPSPVDISTLPPGTTWVSISSGPVHTCGVSTAGDAYCWGNDASGKLGNGSALTADQDHPVLVPRDALPSGIGWARITAGNVHSCGLTTDGTAYCWGAGNGIGTGMNTPMPSPALVDMTLLPPGTRWVTLQAGENYSCGITTTGATYCWGIDNQGRLGNGPTLTQALTRPEAPVATTVGVVAVNPFTLAGAIADPTNVKLSFAVVPVQPAASGALETAAAGIVASVQSSNEAVVPASNITFSGTGMQRFASINPVGVGTATLTFTVSDAAGRQNSFFVDYGASGAPADPSGRYHMGIINASTAIDVGDGYMLLGDDETQVIYLYKQNESGYPVKTWNLTDPNQLSSNERDIEAAARVGDLVVWSCSQGNGRDGSTKEYRRMIFATRLTGSGANVELTFAGRYGGGPLNKDAQAPLGLRNDLLAWDQSGGHGLGPNYLGLVAASQPGVLPNAPSGMNVEGLEFAADGSTGLLGFRAPTINIGGTQHALIVPVTNILQLVNGVPTQQSGLATFGAPIFLDLAGRSIRELRRNGAGQYLIAAGPPDNATVGVNDSWALYAWDGDPSHAPMLNQLLPDADYLTGGAWEAILATPNPISAGADVLLVADSGDTQFFGTSSLVQFGKSYSQHITLK